VAIFGLGANSQTWRKLVAFIREPALAIWQATKCLAELQARTEAPDVCEIIADAEGVLLDLMLTLMRRPGSLGSVVALANGNAP
jgi:hypothetical protein